MKCRDNRLNDKKYLKEEMENAINGGIKEEKSNRYSRRTTNNTNTNNNEIYATRSRYCNRNDNLEQTSDRRYKRNKDNFEKEQARNTEHYERFTRKIDRECGNNCYGQDERIYTSRREIQGEKYGFQNKDNFYSNNYRNYSRLDNNSITLIAIDILANVARFNNIKHPRKIKGWKKNLQKMLDELIQEKELPEHSLYLAQNSGRMSDRVTSYSVCIYEPEYPYCLPKSKKISNS